LRHGRRGPEIQPGVRRAESAEPRRPTTQLGMPTARNVQPAQPHLSPYEAAESGYITRPANPRHPGQLHLSPYGAAEFGYITRPANPRLWCATRPTWTKTSANTVRRPMAYRQRLNNDDVRRPAPRRRRPVSNTRRAAHGATPAASRKRRTPPGKPRLGKHFPGHQVRYVARRQRAATAVSRHVCIDKVRPKSYISTTLP
jgi:hypothetical protein